MKFLLKCKYCGNQMLYESRGLPGKSKVCVYCGKSFVIRDAILKNIK